MRQQGRVAWVTWVGIALFLTSLLVNRWTVGSLSADGVINSPTLNLVLALAQIAALAMGYWLWRTGSRAALGSLVLLLFVGLFSLGLMEQACRVFLFGNAAFSFTRMQSLVELGETGYVQADPDPEIGYAWRPNVEGWAKLVPFQTNAMGLRDAPVALEKSPGSFRIALVGDSMTTPDGVRLEDAFHTLLEKQLSEDLGRPVECVNFGVSGYYLSQSVATALRKVPAFKPDLLLVDFCSENDTKIRPSRTTRVNSSGSTAAPPKRRNAFYESYLKKLLLAIWFQFHAPVKTPPTQDELANLRHQFALLQNFSRTQKLPVIIAYLGLGRQNPDPVAQLVREAHLPFVDLASPLAAYPLQQCSIYAPLDMHPNAFAQTVIAAHLRSYLKDWFASTQGTGIAGGNLK